MIFAVDRAGLVGEDGETHHGLFDVGFLPSGARSYNSVSPAAGRSFRRCSSGLCEVQRPGCHSLPQRWRRRSPYRGTGNPVPVGRDITLITYGTMINQVIPAAEQLAERGLRQRFCACGPSSPWIWAISTSVRKTGRLLVVEEAEGVGSVGYEIIEKLSQRGFRCLQRSEHWRPLCDPWLLAGAVSCIEPGHRIHCPAGGGGCAP